MGHIVVCSKTAVLTLEHFRTFRHVNISEERTQCDRSLTLPLIPRPPPQVCLYILSDNRLIMSVPVQVHIKLRANHAHNCCGFVVIYSESPGVNHGCSPPAVTLALTVNATVPSSGRE